MSFIEGLKMRYPNRAVFATNVLPVLLILLANALLFLSVPLSDYWWSDAPRHALNGVFLRDFFATLPLNDPRQYAIDYYMQYPALTILFYPPLFPAVAAVFVALFGVSSFSAQLTVAIFYVAASFGAYALARRWLSPWYALAVTLLFLGSHEVALWGRQVMLEIPAYAFLLWAVYLLLRYLDTNKTSLLYATTVVLGLGLYTKISIMFIAPVLLWALWQVRGKAMFRDPHLYGNALLFVVAMIPLMILTLKFGQANVQSVTGVVDAEASRLSLAGWTWYLRALPSQIGPIVLFGAAMYLVLGIFRQHFRLKQPDYGLLIAWVAVGYVFFSLIDLKEARHSVFILYPLALFAVLLVQRLSSRNLVCGAVVAVAAGHFFYTIKYDPVPYVHGYRDAANYIAEHAPKDSAVLFSGYRDGSFIFNLRTRTDREDLSVIRADKLLLRVAVRRSLGVKEQEVGETQLRDMINDYGVHYIVSQPNFWDDLENMKMLQRVLGSSQFEEVWSTPITSNRPHDDKQLKVYKNLGPVSKEKKNMTLHLDMIGTTIESK